MTHLFLYLGGVWESATKVYIRSGHANSCYITYIKTQNNAGGFCYINTSAGGKLAAFNSNGVTGVNVAGNLLDNWYRIYDSSSYAGHIAGWVIAISTEPIIAIEGHDS